MIQLIRHRVNKIAELSELDPAWGAEIDLRSVSSAPGQIILSHDAWTAGDDFEAWVREFSRLKIQGPLILNTKEDGLETRVFEILASHKVSNFFFLDTQIPTLVRLTELGLETRFAARLSAYEPVEFVHRLRGRAQWLWVDCFHAKPLDVAEIKAMASDFKICLVSPELQGARFEDGIERFRPLLAYAHAVCTKWPGNYK